jgi:diguanylate cyclase (GGDEF)-like protein
MTASTLLSNMSIRGKIAIAIVLVAAWAIAAGFLTYRSISRLEEASSWTDHTYDVLVLLGTLQTQLLEFESNQRGYVLTGDERYFKPEARFDSAIRRSFGELRAMTADNPVQQRNLQRFGKLLDSRISVLNYTLHLYEQGGLKSAIAAMQTNDGKNLMDAIHGVLDDTGAEERRLLVLRRAEEQASRNNNNMIIVLAAAGTSVFLLFIILLVRDDLAARTKLHEALEILAMQDALTGLPNRVAFQEGLNRALARATRNQRKLAVLVFDLDGFKAINDKFGHHAGDEMLKTIARRLKKSLRASDFIARIGGDEFILLLDEVAGHPEAGAAAAKIIEVVSQPVDLGIGKEGYVSASVGICMFPEDEVRSDRLIQLADEAMYRAKQAGKSKFRYHARSRGED